MIEIFKFSRFYKYLIPSLGGFFGGLAISNNFWIILMPISLSILWSGLEAKKSNFFWGFFFILTSHYWLIYLHPLTWLGYTWLTSIFISLSILLICSTLGGLLISLWSLIGKYFCLKKYLFLYTNYQVFIKVLFLACIWALGELLLKQTPFFWIGLGESLIPGDLYLAGLARWFGSSGLCVIQLLIGFWLFFIYKKWRQKKKFKDLFCYGMIFIIFLHFVGASLIATNTKASVYPVAVWQTNIPTRQKAFLNNRVMSEKFIAAQEKALSKEAKLLITPEGTINNNFMLDTPSLIDTLMGGLRMSGIHLRSSLMLFKKGDLNYTTFIDKYRLVPLGEKLPRLFNRLELGFSSLGGLQSGNNSRYFDLGKTPPFAIAICYEISDGLKIRNAINHGSELIISIANLDPYPMKIQKQFLSLARIRSIENNKDNIIISNTGPSGLIKNDGRIAYLLDSFVEQIETLYPRFTKQNTLYNKFGEQPLMVLSFLMALLNLKSFKRLTN